MPEFLYATSHLAGDFVNPGNAVGNTPGTWAGELNTNANVTSRWALGNPVDPLTPAATQTIRATFRKGSNSGTPNVQLNLYENGALVQALGASVGITNQSGQTVTRTFDSSAISNRDNVEIEVVMSAQGGNTSTRNSAQVSHIEWEADTTAGGGDPAFLDQTHYRLRNDDGIETEANWKAAANTSAEVNNGERFRVRFGVVNSGGELINTDWQLFYNRNGAGWNPVTASSAVIRCLPSGWGSTGDPTTQQLTSGDYTSGLFEDDDGYINFMDVPAGHSTEHEIVLETVVADVVETDTIQLRLAQGNWTALDAYTEVAEFTVGPEWEPPPVPPLTELVDDFGGYPLTAWSQGSTHGPWFVKWTGSNGLVTPIDVSGEGRVLQLEAFSDAFTSSSLVHSVGAFDGDVHIFTRLRTVAQLKQDPETWETVWLGWNYDEPEQNKVRYYYIVLKTDGFELGKVDQTIPLPGDPWGQRFLVTDENAFTVGDWHDVEILQEGARIRVWIDEVLRADFTDGPESGGTPPWGTEGETVLEGGQIVLYHEDARIQYASISVNAEPAEPEVDGEPLALSLTLGAGETEAPATGGTGVIATGGNVFDVGNYRYHEFTESGDFVVTQGGDVDYLIVAGGGGGGRSGNSIRGGGGGGAGGVVIDSGTLSPGTHPVVVGAGGAGGTGSGSASVQGSNGSTSSLDAETATGGGGGGGGISNGSSGGSGGGGGGAGDGSTNTTGGSGVSGQGNAGGGNNGGGRGGGGGGGSSAVGGNGNVLGAQAGGQGGNGAGVWDDLYTIGGGGGGGGVFVSGGSQGPGGTGGGGTGANGDANIAATPGTDGTGGGGGGGATQGSNSANGADGGDGIVVIRYLISEEPPPEVPSVDGEPLNLSLSLGEGETEAPTASISEIDGESLTVSLSLGEGEASAPTASVPEIDGEALTVSLSLGPGTVFVPEAGVPSVAGEPLTISLSLGPAEAEMPTASVPDVAGEPLSISLALGDGEVSAPTASVPEVDGAPLNISVQLGQASVTAPEAGVPEALGVSLSLALEFGVADAQAPTASVPTASGEPLTVLLGLGEATAEAPEASVPEIDGEPLEISLVLGAGLALHPAETFFDVEFTPLAPVVWSPAEALGPEIYSVAETMAPEITIDATGIGPAVVEKSAASPAVVKMAEEPEIISNSEEPEVINHANGTTSIGGRDGGS